MDENSKFKNAGTKFASSERSSDLEMKNQSESIVKINLICDLLNAMPDFVVILNPNRQIVFGNKAVADFAEGQGCICYFGLRPGGWSHASMRLAPNQDVEREMLARHEETSFQSFRVFRG